MRSIRDSLRVIGLGRIAYKLWYRPLGGIRDVLAAGGPIEAWRTARGRREMEAAAHALPTLEVATGVPIKVHVLTGKNYWYQTAFCLWSLAHHSGRPLAPVIYDDGTLEPWHRDSIARAIQEAQFISQADTCARLDDYLPAARFPVLRERWRHYPNIRKLIDVHAGQTDWKLVIDSDLLFFRRPALLIDWLDHPTSPLHAVDCQTSYGYSMALMTELASAPVPERVNVGLCGLRSSELDWEQLEYWCRALIERERTSYYLEQALVAMLVAGRNCIVTPVADYVTLPVEPETRHCSAVMHHYVADAKRAYFQHCWRTALQN